jgi:hypothetical protein
MLRVEAHAAYPRLRSIDRVMQHGDGKAARIRTWTRSKNIDKDMDIGIDKK